MNQYFERNRKTAEKEVIVIISPLAQNRKIGMNICNLYCINSVLYYIFAHHKVHL